MIVRVPASTANLGPGFDAFGMALGLYDHVELDLADDGFEVSVVDDGAGDMSGVPTDENHLVVQAFLRAADHIGLKVPGLRLRCRNAIPHSRGLGSSAAAVVAGAVAAYAFADREPDDDILTLAVEFEGHADNAAASLYGGAVLVWHDERWHAIKAAPDATIRPVVAIAAETSSTDATRGLLPRQVPHADAAFSAGRAALAFHALTARPDLLLAGTEDRLHQPYRASAYPRSARLIAALRARGVAAAVSGAGPTVLALTTDGKLPEDVDTAGFEVRALDVDQGGVRVGPGGLESSVGI